MTALLRTKAATKSPASHTNGIFFFFSQSGVAAVVAVVGAVEPIVNGSTISSPSTLVRLVQRTVLMRAFLILAAVSLASTASATEVVKVDWFGVNW